MRDFLLTLIEILIIGIVVLLCFSCCWMSSISDRYWEDVRKNLDKEKKKNERH